MIGVGPYDMWAIEYGYTFDGKNFKKILSRVAEPELAFCTDEDTIGPDPLGPPLRFQQKPTGLCQRPNGIGQHASGQDPGEICQRRRRLGESPSGIPDDVAVADAATR